MFDSSSSNTGNITNLLHTVLGMYKEVSMGRTVCQRRIAEFGTSAGFNPKAASDWLIVIISTQPFLLTGSRG